MKRAKIIWMAFKKAGVTNPMGIISYGEEQPIDRALTREADTKNRRVEIILEDKTIRQESRR